MTTRERIPLADIVLTLLYGQLLVHAPGTGPKGLLWTDDHVAQGFAWSPGTVAFGVPDHDGDCRLLVRRADAYAPSRETLWALKVPFTVPASPLAIGSVFTTHDVAVPPDTYDLVFEALPAPSDDLAFVLALHFIETPTPDFAILEPGEELTAARILRRDAEPA